MEVQPELASGENKHLQRCINDLVSLLALPAIWSGGDPSQVIHVLLDALSHMLCLDLVCVRLKDHIGERPVEIVRIAGLRGPMPPVHEICEALSRCLVDGSRKWPPLLRNFLGDREVSFVALPLGLQGELGVIVVASEREDFPRKTETLLLNVTANQAALGLQETRLLSQQKLIAAELDQRVAQRTAELAHVAGVLSLGTLAASIAHELNQPLSGIITNAGTCLRMLAADPPNVDGARETARRTIRDGNRASEVIARLRALYGKKDPTTESVDLNEATQEVLALTLSELQRGRVVLRQELADDLPLVTGDRVQLQQVILNLIRNAADAMSDVEDRPRHLLIRTERDNDDRVRLTVQDAGVGFDPQAADKLFESFYSTKNDGMGIGLSVSRSIIDSHHGRLWATLNDGPGAAFSFSIPRAPQGMSCADSIPSIRTPRGTDGA